ncbi:TAXI family TRAP transporter solute-binding subunit [Arenibacterium halophilum]|nr:TAXI family TRAP transporter solute-binding subunit [Arenibacterium halophilum]
MLTFKNAAAAVFLAASAIAAPAVAQTQLNMATVSQTSDDYQFAIALSNILAKDGQYQLTPDGGSGTVKGLRSVAMGRMQLTPIGSPHYADAVAGQGSFKEDPERLINAYKDLRALFAIPTGMAQYVTLANSGIETLGDLEGKRVGIGRPGGNGGRVSQVLFSTYGLDADSDYSPEYIDYTAALEELGDNKLDATLVWGGVPQAGVFNLSRQAQVRFISPEPEKLADFRGAISNGDYYVFREVPAELLKKAYGDDVVADGPAYCWTFPMMIVVSKDMDEQTAYDITKAVWDNVEEMRASSDQLSLLDPNTAIDALSAELHPGSAKYFREIGLLK